MKDQEPKPVNLRIQALNFVLSLYASWGLDDTGDKDIDTTIEYANKIHAYLKGETK